MKIKKKDALRFYYLKINESNLSIHALGMSWFLGFVLFLCLFSASFSIGFGTPNFKRFVEKSFGSPVNSSQKFLQPV